MVLGQSELLERGTCGDLDLCGNDVNAGDFFCDGVLDLTIGLLDVEIAGLAVKTYMRGLISIK